MTLTDNYGEKYKAIGGKIESGDLVFNKVLKKAHTAISSDVFGVTLYSGQKWMLHNVVKVENLNQTTTQPNQDEK